MSIWKVKWAAKQWDKRLPGTVGHFALNWNGSLEAFFGNTFVKFFWARINKHRVLSCRFRWSYTSLVVFYLSESRPRDLLTWTLRCYADARMRLARLAACTGLLFLHLKRLEACGHAFRLLIVSLNQVWMSLHVLFEDGYSMALYKK